MRHSRPRSLGVLAATAALVASSGPSGDAAAQGSLRGVVFDRLAGAPLAAATVQIAPAHDLQQVRTAVADSLGRFAFDSLPAGRWVATFCDCATIASWLRR